MQNHFRKFVAALSCVACVTILAACNAEPKLDASSDQALKESIEKITEVLPVEKRVQFSMALAVIMMADTGNAIRQLSEENMNAEAMSAEFQKVLKDKLNGKTADEIIAMAASITSEQPQPPSQ